MVSTAPIEVPPRPDWMPARNATPSVAVPETLPDEIRQRRLLRGVGNLSSGVLVSLAIHLAILLLLNLWLFVLQPAPSGYVISCELLTGDDGAKTPVNTVIQAPLPDDPPPGEDIRLEPQKVGGGTDGKVARIGGGGAGRGEGAGGGGVGFFGTKAAGNSFVFVVDRSGSMDSDGRMQAAKRELTRAIGTLQPHQKFYVLFYNGSMQRMLGALAPDGLVAALPETKDAVRDWMQSINASGGTSPAEALQTALAMEPDVLFFLTDGQIPETSGREIRAANQHGTVVHTTSLVAEQSSNLLASIAEENGGTYRHLAQVPPGPVDPANRAPQIKNRRAAEAKLRLALRYLELDRPATGRRWLEEVITLFPGTPEAHQAEQRLSQL